MGLPGDFLDEMTAPDLLIGNTDRHEGNSGILIDADTMEYRRPAPLFDSGTSLHCRKDGEDPFKPFFSSWDAAFRNLREIKIIIPSEDTVQTVITEVYRLFGLQKVRGCRHRGSLRECEKAFRKAESMEVKVNCLQC